MVECTRAYLWNNNGSATTTSFNILFTLRFAHTHTHSHSLAQFNNCFYRMLAKIEGFSVCSFVRCLPSCCRNQHTQPTTIDRGKSLLSTLLYAWFQTNHHRTLKLYVFLPFNFDIPFRTIARILLFYFWASFVCSTLPRSFSRFTIVFISFGSFFHLNRNKNVEV